MSTSFGSRTYQMFGVRKMDGSGISRNAVEQQIYRALHELERLQDVWEVTTVVSSRVLDFEVSGMREQLGNWYKSFSRERPLSGGITKQSQISGCSLLPRCCGVGYRNGTGGRYTCARCVRLAWASRRSSHARIG